MPPNAERRPGQDGAASRDGHAEDLALIVRDAADVSPSLSNERDWWLKRLLAAERAAWLAGYEAGNRDGYEHGCRMMELTWPPIARAVQGPTLAELNERRWGPGGRERFGERRPEDRYPRGAS